MTVSSDGYQVQNIILVALKSKDIPQFESRDSQLNEYLGHLWTEEIAVDVPILTDEFAPVDQYVSRIFEDRR